MNIIDYSDNDLDTIDSLFDCEYSSIDSIINKVIVFTGVKTDVETENGARTLISFSDGQNRSAFFTESRRLKEVVCDKNIHFPFRAIIKVVKYGYNTGFKFFSPKSKITQEDIENFEYYKKNKFKRNR